MKECHVYVLLCDTHTGTAVNGREISNGEIALQRNNDHGTVYINYYNIILVFFNVYKYIWSFVYEKLKQSVKYSMWEI